MKYTVATSGIASAQHITDDQGTYWAIYLGPEFLDPHGDIQPRVTYDKPTPEAVRAVVNRNFAMLFSIPHSSRQQAIESMQPTTIETE